jgi:hypothetical protein
VVTSRPRYALYSDFFKRLKDKITDFETFDTAQEYIEVLEQQESLKELAQVPITL